MPTIKRFDTCKIAIYADDHMPPHFHVEGKGFRLVVEIQTLAILAGRDRRAAEAMAWARDHQDWLRAEWARLNRRT